MRTGDSWFGLARLEGAQTLRSLLRAPAFVMGVILTTALAIGTNTAMFAVVDRLMLSPPPGIARPSEVFTLALDVSFDDRSTSSMSTMSYPMYLAVQSVGGERQRVAAWTSDTMAVGDRGSYTRISAVGATGDYFTTLGASLALGRAFGPSDDVLPSGSAVVVLGYEYWRRTYGGDVGIVGQDVRLNDEPFKVIGVARRGFNGVGAAQVDAFVPLSAMFRGRNDHWSTTPGMNIVSLVLRLQPGVLARTVQDRLLPTLRGEMPSGVGPQLAAVRLTSIVPGAAARDTTQGRVALSLFGVALIVLLVAAANVGTLHMIRLERRRRELAVRLALGASRRRIALSLIGESLLLSAAGGAVGVVLSAWSLQFLSRLVASSDSVLEMGTVARMLAATCCAIVVAGMVAVVGPLLEANRVIISVAIRGGGRGTTAPSKARRMLVRAQATLCTVLIVAAMLFIRSLSKVQSQDLGFSTSHLLYVNLEIRGHIAANDRDALHRELAQSVARVPGVTDATVADGIPFGPHRIPPISVTGHPFGQDGRQIPIMYAATPQYLRMMGVTLVNGRLFGEDDRRGSAAVILVNESMATDVWPGESPLGRCVRLGFATPDWQTSDDPAAGAPCREVVGVVRDSRARSIRTEGDEEHLRQYYVPFEQIPAAPFPDIPDIQGLLIQVKGEPSTFVSPIQRHLQRASNIGLYANVRPYQELIDPQLRAWRVGAALLTAYGLLALGIAVVGLVAVVLQQVAERTQDLGVRLALGARPEAIRHMVMMDALRLTGAGVAAGMVISYLAVPLASPMLFGITPRDPLSFAVAAMTLLSMTAAAAAWPALRASRISPAITLVAAE